MKKGLFILLLLIALIFLAFQLQPVKKGVDTVASIFETPNLVNKDSLTIQSRVTVPDGYKRVVYNEASFEDYLRTYKLKPFISKIINYDNTEYFWHGGHI